MEKAYFNQIRKQILSYLDNARTSVSIAMAWFTSLELFEALLACLSKGIKVELVLLDDAINFMDYAPDFNLFISNGGGLRIADQKNGLMHHKFCIVDESILVTGSYNWTYYAETRNNENILVTDNPGVVSDYKEEFERLVALTRCAESSPRLLWNELETREEIDFAELNYEIEQIAKIHNHPVRKVFQPRTIVQMVETKLSPYSRYIIGIEALSKEEQTELVPLISGGAPLPCKSETVKLLLDPNQPFICRVERRSQSDSNDKQQMDLDWDLTSNESVEVLFSMNLEPNGSLTIEISCPKLEKKMVTTMLDSRMVRYA